MVTSNVIVQLYSGQNVTTGDFIYRVEQPAVALNKWCDFEVFNVDVLELNNIELLIEADLLILHHLSDPDILPVVQARKGRRRPTLYEIADHFRFSQAHKPDFKRIGPPEYTIVMEEIIRRCNAVQANNVTLRKQYAPLNEHFLVFPNIISEVCGKNSTGPQGESLTLGWGGSARHLEDLKQIAPSLIEWVTRNPQVRLAIMGSQTIRDLFMDVPPQQRLFQEGGSLSDYLAFLQRLDIGIAPLQPTEFNSCRSDVKYLEYASREVVPVCSRFGPYLEVGEEQKSILLFKDGDELLQHLESLLQDANKRTSLAANALNWVRGNRLSSEQLWARRAKAYRKLLERSARGMPAKCFAGLADKHLGCVLNKALQSQGSPQFLDHFKKAAKLRPLNYQARYFYGWALAQTARYQEAIRELQCALRICPQSVRTAQLLAQIQILAGQTAAADKTVGQSLETEPRLPTVMFLKASLLQLHNELTEAEQLLRECVTQAPTYVQAWKAFISTTIALKKWQEANRGIQELKSLTPESADVPWREASLALAQEEYEKAKRLLEQALEKDPNHDKSKQLMMKINRVISSQTCQV